MTTNKFTEKARLSWGSERSNGCERGEEEWREKAFNGTIVGSRHRQKTIPRQAHWYQRKEAQAITVCTSSLK